MRVGDINCTFANVALATGCASRLARLVTQLLRKKRFNRAIAMQFVGACGKTMFCAGVGHQIKQHTARRQLADQAGGIGKQHIVIRHAVHQQQGRTQSAKLRENAALCIARCVFFGVAQVALGVMRIVELPVGYGRAANTGGNAVGAFGKQAYRHEAAVAPAKNANAFGINEFLFGQPVDTRQLVGHFDLAKVTI